MENEAALVATGAAIDAVKAMLDAVAKMPGVDPRSLATARTQMETGFLWIACAVEGGGPLHGQ